jgi:hypothetical protein
MIREKHARLRWHLVTTTPRPGWYNSMIDSGEEWVLRWDSGKNTYIDRETFDDFCKDMSQEEIEQEMYAKSIALSGLVWSEYVNAPWPAGNRHPHAWNPALPWSLSCDIGNRSAWLVIQSVPQHHGQPIDVVVAEYQPDDGNSMAMIKRIKQDIHTAPTNIASGIDAGDNNPNTLTGTTHSLAFRQAWPSARLFWPTGNNRYKSRQVWHAKSRICHPNSGERLFCVSDSLVSHDARFRRGILEMFAKDTWPRAGEPGGDDFLRKDKARNPESVEDTRDAMLHYLSCVRPPRAADPSWRR